MGRRLRPDVDLGTHVARRPAAPFQFQFALPDLPFALHLHPVGGLDLLSDGRVAPDRFRDRGRRLAQPLLEPGDPGDMRAVGLGVAENLPGILDQARGLVPPPGVGVHLRHEPLAASLALLDGPGEFLVDVPDPSFPAQHLVPRRPFADPEMRVLQALAWAPFQFRDEAVVSLDEIAVASLLLRLVENPLPLPEAQRVQAVRVGRRHDARQRPVQRLAVVRRQERVPGQRLPLLDHLRRGPGPAPVAAGHALAQRPLRAPPCGPFDDSPAPGLEVRHLPDATPDPAIPGLQLGSFLDHARQVRGQVVPEAREPLDEAAVPRHVERMAALPLRLRLDRLQVLAQVEDPVLCGTPFVQVGERVLHRQKGSRVQDPGGQAVVGENFLRLGHRLARGLPGRLRGRRAIRKLPGGMLEPLPSAADAFAVPREVGRRPGQRAGMPLLELPGPLQQRLRSRQEGDVAVLMRHLRAAAPPFLLDPGQGVVPLPGRPHDSVTGAFEPVAQVAHPRAACPDALGKRLRKRPGMPFGELAGPLQHRAGSRLNGNVHAFPLRPRTQASPCLRDHVEIQLADMAVVVRQDPRDLLRGVAALGFGTLPEPLQQRVGFLGQEGGDAFAFGLRLVRPPLPLRRTQRLLPRHLGLHAMHRMARRLQRRMRHADLLFQAVRELLRVVGQQHEPVAGAAHLHVEQRAVRHHAARVQDRDHVVRRDSLRAVHRRCPRVVDVPQSVVVSPGRQPPAVGKPDADALPRDLLDHAPLAVHDIEVPEVAREDDLVPRSQRDRAGLEDGDVVRGVARGPEPAGDAAPLERDPVRDAVRHPPGLALPQAVDVAVRDHDVACTVALRIRRQDPGQAAVHQPLDFQRPAAEDAFLGKPLAEDGVDLLPPVVRGREDHGLRTRFRGKRKPEPGRRSGQPVRRKLSHAVAETLERKVGISRDHVRHGGLEVRQALPEDVVHAGRLHARLLEQAERLSRLHGPELEPVAHEHEPGDPDPLRDMLQAAHLDRADHRGLVDHHDGAPEPFAGLAQLPSVGVAEVPVPRKHPLHRGRADPGLQGHDPGRCGGGCETDYRAVPGQPDDLLQHARLAGARESLHADDAVPRHQDRADRLPLPVRQRRPVEPRVKGRPVRQRRRLALALPHGGDHGLLRLDRSPRGQVAGLRVDKMPVAAQPVDGRLQLLVRMPSRIPSQRGGEKLRAPEDAPAFLQVLRRLPGRLQRRHPRLRPFVPGSRDPRLDKSERLRPAVPELHELARDRFGLPSPRGEGRRVRVRGRVFHALVRHVPEDVPPPRRERVQPFPRPAGDLEARQAADRRRDKLVSEVTQPPRQVVPVPRAEHAPVPVQQRRLDAPPFAAQVARHVRDHGVRVELRIVAAARHVPERRRDHAVRRLARPSARGRVVAPGLEVFPFDPVERRANGLVMRAHDRLPAAVERLQRDRLRGRERQVPAGTVLALAVDHATQRDVGAGNLAGQDGDELSLAHALSQPQGLGARSVPSVGGAVGAVVPGEVLVHEVAEGLPGAGEGARAGEHQFASPARGTGSGSPVMEIRCTDRCPIPSAAPELSRPAAVMRRPASGLHRAGPACRGRPAPEPLVPAWRTAGTLPSGSMRVPPGSAVIGSGFPVRLRRRSAAGHAEVWRMRALDAIPSRNGSGTCRAGGSAAVAWGRRGAGSSRAGRSGILRCPRVDANGEDAATGPSFGRPHGPEAGAGSDGQARAKAARDRPSRSSGQDCA